MSNTFKQILVVGAGAVGGFFGARLARKHDHVSFLLRPKTLEAVKARGLTLRSPEETFTIHPQAASDPKELPSPDLIIIGVKAYDLEEVLRQISLIIQKKTVLLTLQNGVTIEEEVTNQFGQERVVGGVAFIYSKLVAPGIIEHYKRGAVTIGELTGKETPRLASIAELFRTAGVSCYVSKDIRRAKWEKMCWNCVFNPLTVVLNDRVSKALDHPELVSVISSIVGEVVAVAGSENVLLEEDMGKKVIHWSQELRDIHTSMYDDWKSGRPTEIDCLNGYIARKGKELHIPTPVNEALTALVKVITEQQTHGEGILRIEGEVIQSLSFTAGTLATLASDDQVRDIGVLAPNMRGVGIRVKALLEVATLHIDADHVTFHSQDGRYAASMTLAQARDFGILVYQLDGGSLPEQKGGPFRLIAPGLGDLCANVKQVSRIEISRGPGKDTRPSQSC